MNRSVTRSPRRLLVGVLAAGVLVPLLAAGPASAAGPAGSGRPAPDLTALQQSLAATSSAGAPGVFARLDDSADGTHELGVGTGDLTTGAPVDPAGRFRVGSVNKTFTAVLVLQLVAEHRVDLDAPAAGYLPDGVLPADSPITVRELLDHTSGLYDYTNDLLAGDTVTGYENFRYRTYDPADLVASSLAHGQDFAPGSRYEYSNTNFVVLGMLVEHLTGRTYPQALDERVLRPLHLTGTSFVVPTTTIAGPHAVGYLTEDDRTKPLFDATDQTGSWIWTAGALISDAADLNRYLRALATGELLPPEQLAEMEDFTAVDSTGTSLYGLGLREYKLSCGIDVIGHDGIVEGYQTYAYSTVDGTRQLTVSADASNNTDVFTAERTALDPAFCGATAPAATRRADARAAANVADAEGDA